MSSITSATGSGGSISSAGIGSGLDVNSIISSLMKVEQLPLNKLQATATDMQTRLSAFGQMQSLVSAFHDASVPLYSASSYAITNTNSSDASSVSAGSTTAAIPGSYAVSVSQLSSTQSVVSASGTGQFANASEVVGSGTITISLGAWNTNPDGTLPASPAFTPKSGASDIVIPVGSGTDTLQQVADAINKAAGGVSATVVTDASGARLALQSTTTGASNGFRVAIADSVPTNTATQGLSRLAFDPQNGANAMSLSQAAKDTKATINGIAVTTASNTLTDVVGGMTFVLSKVTSSPVTVNVTQNTDAVKTMLTSFVAAYNALTSFLSQATKFDPATKKGALLQGDATATGLQNQLRQMVSQPGSASSAFSTLSSIGIEFQKDGTLKLNDTKVAAALKNLPELTKAMSNVDSTTPDKNGFAKKIADWTGGLLASNGTLPGKSKSIQKQIAANQKDQERLNTKLAAVETRLRAQYTTLDTAMSKANALQQYVSQQITTWNKNTA
jgi:flagellar hook-associated protein 2